MALPGHPADVFGNHVTLHSRLLDGLWLNVPRPLL